MTEDIHLTRSQIAKHCNCHVTTVLYWTRALDIEPHRTEGGHRKYTLEEANRIIAKIQSSRVATSYLTGVK